MQFARLGKILAGAVWMLFVANLVGSGSEPSKFVKVDASATKIDADGKQTVTVTLDIEKNWRVYANPVKNEEFSGIQTILYVRSDVKLAALEVKYPTGKLWRDNRFRELSFMYYDGKVSITANVQRIPGDSAPLTVEVRFQPASDNGVCQFPEQVRKVLR